jgi:hypothetical protein
MEATSYGKSVEGYKISDQLEIGDLKLLKATFFHVKGGNDWKGFDSASGVLGLGISDKGLNPL